MIAAILITVLVVLIAAVWFAVLVLETMAAVRKAANRYTDTHPLDLPRAAPKPHPPTDPSGSPHSVWRTRGSQGE